MPIGGYNVGRDWAIEVFDPIAGGLVQLPLITGFSRRQDTAQLESVPLDGRRRRVEIPLGWSGSITFDRTDPRVDAWLASHEEAFEAGLDVPFATLVETVREVDGSITVFRYPDVCFVYSNAGDVRGNDKAEQTVEWYSGRRQRVV